jgi:hypothetical protein
MFVTACVYAMLMRTSCDQHCLSVMRVSHREASGLHNPKCCVAGNMKLKVVILVNRLIHCVWLPERIAKETASTTHTTRNSDDHAGNTKCLRCGSVLCLPDSNVLSKVLTVPRIINQSLQRIHVDEAFHHTKILQAVNAMLDMIIMTAAVTNSWSLVGRFFEFAMSSTRKHQWRKRQELSTTWYRTLSRSFLPVSMIINARLSCGRVHCNRCVMRLHMLSQERHSCLSARISLPIHAIMLVVRDEPYISFSRPRIEVISAFLLVHHIL